ncbi:MAG: hypothetical protein GF401_12080 [Chitinivibrionales bacterium]|nr:hypothetical protein [Chitinivibrionales bacterium]
MPDDLLYHPAFFLFLLSDLFIRHVCTITHISPYNCMNKTSLMTRRIRSGKSPNRSKFPRKGRIRLILGIIAAAVLLRVFLGAKSGKSETTHGKKTTEIKQASVHTQTDKKKGKPSLPVKKRRGMVEFDDVKAVLKKYPPTRFSINDTLHFKKESWIVHYSLDTLIQEYGKKLFKRYHPQYGAAVLMEPSTGRIKALLSYTHDSASSIGTDLYCKSIYPAASIFKTITVAAALENNLLTPSSCIKLTGRRYTLYNFQLEEELSNYKNISLTKAYAYSINPVFGRIGIYITGFQELQEYAHRFGFGSSVPFELPVEKSKVLHCDSTFCIAELASGFNQKTTLSPLLGALIASAITNDGRMPFPRLVDSISDCSTGEIRYKPANSTWREPVKPSTAQTIRTMMSKVTRNGTARRSFRYMRNSYRFKNVVYGGKTGSVDKDGLGKADWFIGFASHNDDPRQRVAVGVVTVHHANWTVHSSYLGAELMRRYIRNIQLADERREKLAKLKEQDEVEG